jgi:ribonucleoside-triphosphate reductase
MKKRQKCEIYSRVVGYLSPVSDWNKGKKEEFKDRQTFNLNSDKSKSNIS